VTQLERILLEALEGVMPLAQAYACMERHKAAIDRADDAISLARRTARGEYHPGVRSAQSSTP